MREEIWDLSDAHEGHDKHMCHLVAVRKLKTASQLSKNAKHFCRICGRAAAEAENLCEPIEIE